MGAQWLAIVKVCALEPLPIPRATIERQPPTMQSGFPAQCAIKLTTRMAPRNKFAHYPTQKPAQPDRFTAPFYANAIHAIVPIATAHQRQTMNANTQTAINGACRVFVDRRTLGADRGHKVGIFSTLRDGGTIQKWNTLVEQSGVTRCVDIVRAGKGQP